MTTKIPTWDEFDLKSMKGQDDAHRVLESTVTGAEKEAGEAVQAFMNARSQQDAKVKEKQGTLARFLELVAHQRDVGTPQDEARVEKKTKALTEDVHAAARVREEVLVPLVTKVNETDDAFGQARDMLAAVKAYIEMARDEAPQKGASASTKEVVKVAA